MNMMTDYQIWKQSAISMMDSLPVGGGTIVAITNTIALHLRDKMVERLGVDVARRWQVVGILRAGSVCKLIGRKGTIILDSSFVRLASANVRAEVERLATAANATTSSARMG